jgi:hypothetical protein
MACRGEGDDCTGHADEANCAEPSLRCENGFRVR